MKQITIAPEQAVSLENQATQAYEALQLAISNRRMKSDTTKSDAAKAKELYLALGDTLRTIDWEQGSVFDRSPVNWFDGYRLQEAIGQASSKYLSDYATLTDGKTKRRRHLSQDEVKQHAPYVDTKDKSYAQIARMVRELTANRNYGLVLGLIGRVRENYPKPFRS